jgi:alcohol dehydrogenase, propanol-preferring
MKAMILNKISSLRENKQPLELVDLPIPEPDYNEILIKISVCGVCHTELDEIEGRAAPSNFPRVLGHQVVGTISKLGNGISKLPLGQRVGVAWIFYACGKCKFCLSGCENLCDRFLATGRDVDGGYAEYMTVHEDYVYPIPDIFTDAEAAPLLCAGAIGYRSLSLTQLKDGQNLGLTGFGASAHLVLKMLKYRFPQTKVFVFARKEVERLFAKELGAYWTGNSNEKAPEKMACIIDTTPAWEPVISALDNLEKGGRLIINAIRKENDDKGSLKFLSYQDHLWNEKEIKSVANVTGKDVKDFLALASEMGIKPEVQIFPLEDANKALLELKEKRVKGAKVLKIF